jgi:hypothetical protein
MNLWNTDTEVEFFTQALKNFATPEQLFYKLASGYFAYIPNKVNSESQTLQSRNSLIGNFTEKWCRNLLEPIAKSLGLYAVNGMVCEEIGLSKLTSADVAFCTTNAINQKAENVKLLFEVKMSITGNYQYLPNNQEIKYIGDYKSHKGQPSIMRSDSMLKAIGKSINIRVSGLASSKIPIFVIGNTPITESYQSKVDFLKNAGVIQGFISVNPQPTQTSFLKQTPQLGFQTIHNQEELSNILNEVLSNNLNFFSSMISKQKLGEIVYLAAQEASPIIRAEKFLSLIKA